jgi:hypothetical protein
MTDSDTQGKQLDLLDDYGQHSRATQKAAAKLKRTPNIERVLLAIRDSGARGLTRDEIAMKLAIPVQSVCSPVLSLLRDQAIEETKELRKTRWGAFATVLKEATR